MLLLTSVLLLLLLLHACCLPVCSRKQGAASKSPSGHSWFVMRHGNKTNGDMAYSALYPHNTWPDLCPCCHCWTAGVTRSTQQATSGLSVSHRERCCAAYAAHMAMKPCRHFHKLYLAIAAAAAHSQERHHHQRLLMPTCSPCHRLRAATVTGVWQHLLTVTYTCCPALPCSAAVLIILGILFLFPFFFACIPCCCQE